MNNTRFGFTYLVSVLCFGAYALQATTFTVTRTNVTGPGSLPVIITQANATPGDNVIDFAVTDPIVLVSPLPPITNNVTVNGRIDVPTVISGGGTVPIFTFAVGTTNILSQLLLVNGYTVGDGAAISNAGTLFVNNCVITNNRSINGGAVRNGGSMTIVGSDIINNQATSGGGGYSSGGLTIANSVFMDNLATNGNGGGVLNNGVMIVSASCFSGNRAGNGGAICSTGSLSIATLSVSNNQATLGFGGGVFSSGSLNILDTTMSANSATGGSGGATAPGGFTITGGGGAGFGGGLFVEGGSVAVTNCTFSGNTAFGGSGGTYNGPSGSGGGNNGATVNSPAGFGGGGWANYPGGFGGGGSGSPGQPGSPGAFGQAGCYGVNGGGGGGAGLGAGIFVKSGFVTLVSCTLTANTSQGGAAGGGPCPGLPGNSAGGGIFNLSGTVGLLNTIVAADSAFYWPGTANIYPDLYGAFGSSGFNLIGNNQGATNLSINDFQNVPAGLGPLQDNSGPTLTCALLQGSLAIGAGTSIGAPPTDQRGVARPPGNYDIGAFQLVTLITPTIQWTNPADIIYGTLLGSSQLNATVGAAGTLTYIPPAGTVLPAGSNQTLQVVFIPADPTQYTSATNSVRVTVLKANQTITFGAIPNHQLGDPPVLLSASASSGLQVSFAMTSGPATLTGNLLSFGSTTGWVTVAATQAGNNNYNATEVDQTFYLGTLPVPSITTQPC
jgi:predicted outer membrane repeat protein